ncbi:hypothetical protein GF373_09745, partial [bacterium]|nr:hypothetical protein [bacterium]
MRFTYFLLITFLSFIVSSLISFSEQIEREPVLLPENNKPGMNFKKEIVPKRVNLPAVRPLDLRPYAYLGAQASIEPSGLVKSRLWKDVYWSQNDSGDIPRIFPVNRNGDVYESSRYGGFDGCRIQDAVNVDWEDMAIDND